MSAALAGIDNRDPPGRGFPLHRQPVSSVASTRPLALVVDDSAFLALHLARQLEALGFHAHVPADASDLRARLAQAVVVCVELELFHASGFEVTRELAQQCYCPLVLLTGTGRKTDLQWGLRAGASAVVERPVRVGALRSTLARIGCGEFLP
jgi:CheY-like chemotaxis protein